MVEIILMEPSTPGNIGAVARVMKNFNINSLTLISPKCDHLHSDAVSRAVHGVSILKKAKIKPLSCLKEYALLAATTAKLGTDYNLPRTPITPGQFADKICRRKGKIAVLFGREDIGLTNKELLMADITIHIPSSDIYPTLNLSHAVSIVCYEIFQSSFSSCRHFPLATSKDMKILEKKFNSVLSMLKFSTPQKKQTQKIVWKRVFGRAMLTRRELFAVLGLLKKLKS